MDENNKVVTIPRRELEPRISFAPTNFADAMKFSELVAQSGFAPKDFKGKPADVFLAIQMGAEIGLAPMQALQNIAVINGRPSVWGDAALAVVQNHPAYEWHKETIEGDTAVFQIKRKGNDVHEVRFGDKEAKQAGLLGKQGPWSQYPQRMKQMRARGFGLRDKFADALKGLITAEEAEDYPSPDNAGAGERCETLPPAQEPVFEPPTGAEPVHRPGHEHPAKTCRECLKAGVPQDCLNVVNNGHFYIRKVNSAKEPPEHTFQGKSYLYCPPCKADWEKLSPEEQAAAKTEKKLGKPKTSVAALPVSQVPGELQADLASYMKGMGYGSIETAMLKVREELGLDSVGVVPPGIPLSAYLKFGALVGRSDMPLAANVRRRAEVSWEQLWGYLNLIDPGPDKQNYIMHLSDMEREKNWLEVHARIVQKLEAFKVEESEELPV